MLLSCEQEKFCGDPLKALGLHSGQLTLHTGSDW